MRILVCGNGDANTGDYKIREKIFLAHLANETMNLVPRGTQVSSCSIPGVEFPDIDDRIATQAFLDSLLEAFNFPSTTDWKAEKRKDAGLWMVFYLSGPGY
jgi:hypothetical protein